MAAGPRTQADRKPPDANIVIHNYRLRARHGFDVGVETTPTPQADYDLRGALSDLGDALAEHETGLLLTVDEMQSGDFEEIPTSL